MIDLHTHTSESDGSLCSRALVIAATQIGLEALAITDHDTLSGYDQAVSWAREVRLDLVCGIELSTNYAGRSVHLLGYFLHGEPGDEFRQWIAGLQVSRYARNQRLVDKLQQQGLRITLEEVQERARTLPGRPHFAATLVEKGYVSSIQQAFDDYLSETGACFVSREEPTLAEGIRRIDAAGGLPSLPHPGRVSKDPQVITACVGEMLELGLVGIEVYHSDHSPADIEFYTWLASRHSLAITGGSDFHGDLKRDVALGTGKDKMLCVPHSVLDELRRLPR